MAELIAAAGPYRLRVQPGDSPFRHLAEAIIGQQISGAAARAITTRFVALTAASERRDGFPTPDAVLALADHQLGTTLRAWLTFKRMLVGRKEVVIDL